MEISEAMATPRRTPKPITRMMITQTTSMGQKTPGTMSRLGATSSATCRCSWVRKVAGSSPQAFVVENQVYMMAQAMMAA